MRSDQGRHEGAAQRTEEWFKEREGKLTCSVFGQAAGISPGSRQQLFRRLTKRETFEGNAATAWGDMNEKVALAAYELHTGHLVEEVGFIPHQEYSWLGGSPDGLVGHSGGVEFKCPFDQKVYDGVPVYYMAQCQGLMEVTNREWWDFVCWTPFGMTVTRLPRSREYWGWLMPRLALFWAHVVADTEPGRLKKKEFYPNEITPISVTNHLF